MSSIGEISTRIYDNEFDDAETELEREFRIEAISGWLEANVGQFDNLTYSSFGTGDSFLLEEENILTQLYLKNYYNKQARSILVGGGGGSGSALDWTRLSEGDTTIVRSNKTEIAKNYKSLAGDASIELGDLVYSYNFYRSMPRQTAGIDGGYVSGSGSYE